MTTVALEYRPVLILNSCWRAIRVARLPEALAMLFKTEDNGLPKARIVDVDYQLFTWDDWAKLSPKEGEDAIRGVDRVFRVPEVVILTSYDKTQTHKVSFNRRTIYRRDNYQCQYCGAKPGSEELTIDHILPRSRGGKSTWENCVLACIKCNSKKADNLLEHVNMKLRRQPFKPKFNPIRCQPNQIPKSWSAFLDEAYWTVELDENTVD